MTLDSQVSINVPYLLHHIEYVMNVSYTSAYIKLTHTHAHTHKYKKTHAFGYKPNDIHRIIIIIYVRLFTQVPGPFCSSLDFGISPINGGRPKTHPWAMVSPMLKLPLCSHFSRYSHG